MATDPKELKKAEEILNKINAIYRTLGKQKLKLIDVESLDELPGVLGSAREELENLEGSATNLYAQLKGVTQEIKGQGSAIGDARKGYRDLTKLANTLAQDEKEIAQLGVKELEKLGEKAAKAQDLIRQGAEQLMQQNDAVRLIEEELALQQEMGATADQLRISRENALLTSKALNDEEKAILLAYHDQDDISQQILDKAAERLQIEKDIEKQASGFSTLSNIVKSIPGLSGLSGPFEKAAQAAKDTAREGGSGLASFAAGGRALMAAFGPLTAAITAFKFLKDVAFGIDEKQTNIAKSMSLSVSESTAMYKQFKNIKKDQDSIFETTKNLIKAQGSLASAFGATRGFTKEQLKDQVKLVNQMGLEAETANGLQQLAMTRGESADKSVDSIISATQALKMQTGIQLDQKAVLDEVAKTDGQLAANYKNNPGMIAKAVTQVRKLGLSLSQANKMSSSLLDFESSLAAEMEAEVMLGKDLNLNKARELALAGDAAGAAAEMRKQVGSLNDFQNLSVLQQNALAKAVGMTSDELANSLRQEENLQSLGSETRKQIEERVKQLKAEGKVAEANRLLSQSANEEDAKAALERVSVQQEFQAALDIAKETFAEIFDENFNIAETARSIASVFQNLGKNIKVIKGIAIAVGIAFGLIAVKAAIAAAAAIATASAATLGIGAIAIAGGIALAAAAMSDATSQATADSKADDVAIPGGYGKNIIKGPEGSIALNNNDSIVAGTDLFRGKNNSSDRLLQKIDRLIAVVEQGGHVYLDGSKVGSAMALSAKLSN